MFSNLYKDFFDLQELQLTDTENGPNDNFNDDLNGGDTTDGFTANAELNEFNENPVELSPREKVVIRFQ